MELNWTTFLLELVNFLVLVWILKRFLYRPVQEVIARRRAGIEKTLTDAHALRTEAETLRQQYENRLADWEQERRLAREALIREIEAERTQRRAGLHADLDREREKARVIAERQRADALRGLEQTALAQGARFAARLLESAAGPETEARLVELALTELSQLPIEKGMALRNHRAGIDERVVASAFPLPEGQRLRLTQALAALSGGESPVRFEQDASLIAGLRISIGPWVLAANVRDELQGFAELGHGD
ncbi:MAG: F0F1 ATP synthase subunit delta [Gammaproteobacteria bacterium]|nr:F0F1 ATP synthase subunit delta [Gammaproteobacteria bacterium]MBU1655447.1 F0F1 ATP synthase subunit delta [Gammaproteobacteria bacterium]MBU1962414.1 F0F1 ATP synthase subunit delta [Gammaproteobacteria bacterium]